MKSTSYYPVIMTQDVRQTADFYVRHLGFEALFVSDWYMHLQSSRKRTCDARGARLPS